MKFEKLAIFVLLLQIENVADSIVIRLLPLMLLAISVFYNFSVVNVKNITNFLSENSIFYIAYIILIVGILRNNSLDISLLYLFLRIITVTLFFLLVISYNFRRNVNLGDAMKDIIIQPYVYFVLFNLFLWIAHIDLGTRGPGSLSLGYATVLSYIGINIQRVEFAFAGGFNNYSSYVGLILLFCSINFFIIRTQRFKNMIAIGATLITLVLIDSRAAFYYPILITIALIMHNRLNLNYKSYRLMYILPIAGPLLLTFLLPFIADVDSLKFLSRSDDELQTGNSRLFIWGISLIEFISLKPIHLIGYGEYGHFGSGASKQWSGVFGTWDKSEMKSPHNTLFNILFDYGYLGLLLYISLLVKFLRHLNISAKIRGKRNILYLGFFIYNGLQCITESLFGFYFQNYFLLFWAVMLCESCDYYLLKRDQQFVI